MQPFSSASQSSTTQSLPAQGAAAAGSSTGSASFGIIAVQPVANQLATGMVRLQITTTNEYPISVQHPAVQCQPVQTPDGMGGFFEHRCEITTHSHRHSVTAQQNVPSGQNPLPAGAKERLQSMIYTDPAPYFNTMPLGYTSAEFTEALLYETPAAACVPAVLSAQETQEQVTKQCQVQAGHHIHSSKKPVFLPLAQTPIADNAFAIHQHIKFMPDQAAAAAPALALPQPPARMQLTAREFILAKLQRLNIASDSITQWVVPRMWDRLPANRQQRYLDDIVQCYNLGANYSEIGARHGIRNTGVRALLWLRLDSLRDPSNERETGIQRGFGRLLSTWSAGLPSDTAQSSQQSLAPFMPTVLPPLPSDLPPLERALRYEI